MKILVVGDRIIDHYRFCRPLKLCPEACAPALVVESEATSNGGAALVTENIESLSGEKILSAYGSISHKERTFADRTLICRIDRDRYSVLDPTKYWNQILALSERVDLIAVADYGKGAITPGIASGLLATRKPLFVDAKANIDSYKGCFAVFPNEHEHPTLKRSDYQNIIRKLGSQGCTVNGLLVGTHKQHVYDVTGAGDCFLAGFVKKFAEFPTGEARGTSLESVLLQCAAYANVVAGISVQHLGTHIVTPVEVQQEKEVLQAVN